MLVGSDLRQCKARKVTHNFMFCGHVKCHCHFIDFFFFSPKLDFNQVLLLLSPSLL